MTEGALSKLPPRKPLPGGLPNFLKKIKPQKPQKPKFPLTQAKKAAKLMKDLGKSVTVIAMPPDGGFTVTAVDPTNFAGSEPNPFDELLK